MSVYLDRTSRRIIGVLLEKEATTPQGYPLSMNALLNGCCQKSNRDPVMDLQEFELEGALRSLQVDGWVANVREAGSRVEKWRHKFEEKLDCLPEESAILCELMLRGAQQPGELRTRCNRLHGFADVAAIMDCLDRLIIRGLTQCIGKRPGERAERFDHCLYPQDELADSKEIAPSTIIPEMPPSHDAQLSHSTHDITDRLDRLEEQLQRLEMRLDELTG